MIEWRDVPGYEKYYSVSSGGEIYSKRWKRIMRPAICKSGGYPKLVLHDGSGNKKSEKVHRIVLSAFRGPAPSGMIACHNNGNPRDNRVENLRWGTPRDNMLDRVLHGTDPNRNRLACPRGHLLEEPNLQAAKARQGWRACKACHRARSNIHCGAVGTLQEIADHHYKQIMRHG